MNESTTCHHDRCPTKFCPNCGAQTRGLPIYGLRQHIVKFIGVAEAEVRRLEDVRDQAASVEDIDVNRRHAHWLDEQAILKERVVVKWKSWLDALDELLAKQPPNGEPDA